MRIIRLAYPIVAVFTALALCASPVMADWSDSVDIVKVLTDKTIYARGEPILVMAEYDNFGESKLLALPSPGGLDIRVILRRVGAQEGEQHEYYGPLKVINQNFSGGVAEGHSATVIAQTMIPTRKIRSGLYQIVLIFNVASASNPPELIFQARPQGIIMVR